MPPLAGSAPPPGGTRAPVSALSRIRLEPEQIALLTEEGLWQKVRLDLPGSDGVAVRLRGSDMVTVGGRIEAVVRLGEER